LKFGFQQSTIRIGKPPRLTMQLLCQPTIPVGIPNYLQNNELQ